MDFLKAIFIAAGIGGMVAASPAAADFSEGWDESSWVNIRIEGTATVIENNVWDILDAYPGIYNAPNPNHLHTSLLVGESHGFSYSFSGTYGDILSSNFIVADDAGVFYHEFDDSYIYLENHLISRIWRQGFAPDGACTDYYSDINILSTSITIDTSMLSDGCDQVYDDMLTQDYFARAVSTGKIERLFINGDPVSLDRYFDVNAIPEPASWALMIAGFGLVGSALRRKERVQAKAIA